MPHSACTPTCAPRFGAALRPPPPRTCLTCHAHPWSCLQGRRSETPRHARTWPHTPCIRTNKTCRTPPDNRTATPRWIPRASHQVTVASAGVRAQVPIRNVAGAGAAAPYPCLGSQSCEAVPSGTGQITSSQGVSEPRVPRMSLANGREHFENHILDPRIVRMSQATRAGSPHATRSPESRGCLTRNGREHFENHILEAGIARVSEATRAISPQVKASWSPEF